MRRVLNPAPSMDTKRRDNAKTLAKFNGNVTSTRVKDGISAEYRNLGTEVKNIYTYQHAYIPTRYFPTGVG